MTTPNPSSRLQVIVTSGGEDPHRTRMGLELALTAATLDAEVHVFLTVRAAQWAEARRPGSCTMPGCESIPELLMDLLEAGVIIECCSACASQFVGACGSGPELLQGIALGGLATVAERTMDGVPTVTI